MNKAAIKNFAIEARKKLIASVKDKAGRIGITKDKITKPISEGEGFAIFPTHIGIEAKLSGKELAQRENLVNKIKSRENGYELVMEEVAYTWFNRIIAVRFMEVNDYLPSRIRVLSSETKGKFEPDIVTQAPNIDLNLTQQEIEESISLKEKNEMDKLFRFLFIKQCNELGKILPELFENTSRQNNDYTEILLDISYTNQDGVIRDLLTIDEDDFLDAVEIIGWMYQYYNTEPKDETFALLKKNVKISKDRIPAATQLFTPDWIVRYMVENSLGRLWLEGHPNDDLKANWKYYLDEAEQEPKVQDELENIRAEYKAMKPEDIKVIDPCMGSGHILVYAFEVLMQIYESYGYTQRDAAMSILENNLYGLDIDDRAYQLAYFAVMMKARKYNRRILNGETKCRVYAIQESNSINKNHLQYFGTNFIDKKEWLEVKDQIDYLLDLYNDAKEYGSILNVNQNLDFDKILSFIENIGLTGQMIIDTVGIHNTQIQLCKLMEIVAVMKQKYDVVVTNPPYMGNMPTKMTSYVVKNYPIAKYDLYAVFTEKCLNLVGKNKFIAMITQHAWMFLSSFEKFRQVLLLNNFINMAHLGARAFEEIGGEVVQTTAFVARKNVVENYIALFIRLVNYTTQEEKKKCFFNVENKYCSKQENFNYIPGLTFAYWVHENTLNLFQKQSLADSTVIKSGIVTGNNDLFLKRWYEISVENIQFDHRVFVDNKNIKWVPMHKGGEYRKYYGNHDYIMNLHDIWEPRKTSEAVRRGDINYYFKQGITWSTLATNLSARLSPMGFIFDTKGSMCFVTDEKNTIYILGLLNSAITSYIMEILSPTLDFNQGAMGKMPLIIDEEHRKNIEELVSQNLQIAKLDWDLFESSWDFTSHPLRIYRTDSNLLSDAFNTWLQIRESWFAQQKSNEENLNRVFINIYGLHEELTPEIQDKDVTIRKADLKRDIRSFTSYAVGCMFGRYSLDIDGLAYAGGSWDDSKYLTFTPDKDNIIPITDEEYFTDDIVGRLVEFVKVVYGQETLEENLDFIAEALENKGSTSREIIRNYFIKDFYKDHIKIYKKRPIYWLFDSGKECGFKALIYMHRYNEDTVGSVRADYLHKTQAAIENAIAHCDVVLESSTSAGDKAKAVKQKTKLIKQLSETRIYDQAIAHIAHKRIPIDLDDGVKVNYDKFQGIEVANEGKKTVKIDLLGKI